MFKAALYFVSEVIQHPHHWSAFWRADGTPVAMISAALAQSAEKSSPDLCKTGGKKLVTLEEEDSLCRPKLASHGLAQLPTDGVHDLVDQFTSSMSKPWKGSIPVQGRILMRRKMPDEYFFSTPLEDLNIADHIHNQNPSASRLYLCNKMYPPPPY